MGGSGFRGVLQSVKPFVSFLPEIPTPDRKITLREKVTYTVISLFIFLVCSQLPLFGIHSITGAADPFCWMRASSRGTVMELGIEPIVISSLLVQLLSNKFHVDSNVCEDRALLKGAQKLLAILIAIGQAVAYIQSGTYGSVALLGVGNAVLIILQLCFAVVVMMCLNELLEKSYGHGYGISLFMATNICKSVTWTAFSPRTINKLLTALREAFYRQNLSNVINLLSTVVISLILMHLGSFRVVLPFRSRTARGQQWSYQIKPSSSNMAIILQSQLVSNLKGISQLLYTRYRGFFLVNLLGKWQESQFSGQLVPVGGLAYYITAPSSLAEMAADPLHALFYIAFMLIVGALLSELWHEFCGPSAKDVVKQLKEHQMVMPGHVDSNLEKELNLYIRTAAFAYGLGIGAMAVLADLTGPVWSRTGIVLAVTIIYHTWSFRAVLVRWLGLLSSDMINKID